MANDDLEDVGLAVSGASLGIAPDWLPAVEQFGEGLFVLLSPEALDGWLRKDEVQDRTRLLERGASGWIAAKQARGCRLAPLHCGKRNDITVLVHREAIGATITATATGERRGMRPTRLGQLRDGAGSSR